MNFAEFKVKYQKKEVQEFSNKAPVNPIVSVCVLTYQQASYIKECLDGILMQQTDFPFEIILGEDGSTDGTRKICIEYAKKYPEKIRLFLHYRDNNISIAGRMTARFNLLYSLFCSRGRYIAYCEGDDYWIDPKKLQKQIDFLNLNKDYSICFHRVFEQQDNHQVLSKLNPDKENTYTILDLANGNLIHTPSVVFRNQLFESFPEWFNKVPVGDYAIHMINAQYGKIKYFPEVMAVYRIHEGGVWSSKSRIITLERWIEVLALLIYGDFSLEVLQILKSQKRRYINELLSIYLKFDLNEFKKKLKKFDDEDSEIGKEWLFKHYPNYILSYRGSTIYQVLKKVQAIKNKLLRS